MVIDTRKVIADILIQGAYNKMLAYGERQHRSPQLGAMSANIEKAKPVESRQVRRARLRQERKR